MSVLINGMEMPKDCSVCYDATKCLGAGRCFEDGTVWCGMAKGYIGVNGTAEKCPLVELPEKHGRLIDAKVLDAAFTALRFNDDGTLRHWDDRKNWCLHGGEVEILIADAPTIVEAEE